MSSPARVRLRDANVGDAGGVHMIYAPAVASTPISFETEVPSVDEMAERIASTTVRFPWLVAELDGDVVGYAYAGPFNDRAAYRWSVATSVYVADAAQRRGVARMLYDALLPRVRTLGYVNAYAGIALPNEASVALHERFGFRRVAVFPAAGYKLGAWHDVGWWWLALVAPPPVAPRDVEPIDV
ncbi:MAG TPA: arsinothricin resistance N-acetyltransferase ArsN1 family B [Acidimicrobiia bacterium]